MLQLLVATVKGIEGFSDGCASMKRESFHDRRRSRPASVPGCGRPADCGGGEAGSDYSVRVGCPPGDRDSDLDFMVVKAGVLHRRRLPQHVYLALFGIPVPVDILVVTPKDIEVFRGKAGAVISPALAEGGEGCAAQDSLGVSLTSVDSPGQGGTLPTDEVLACGAVASLAGCREHGKGWSGARLAGETAVCGETQDGIVKEAARQGKDTCTAHQLRFRWRRPNRWRSTPGSDPACSGLSIGRSGVRISS